MSEKSHTVAIGAFIIGALLVALTAVVFLVGSDFGEKEKVIMVFNGSVKGLNVGAPLALRGVQVGQVTKVKVILDADNMELIMLVEADLHAKNIHRTGSTERDITQELISRGLRAQLNTQSLLTGLLYVELDFHPGSEIILSDIESPYFQFPTVPSGMQAFTQKLQQLDLSELTSSVESVSKALDTVVGSEDFQSLPGSLRTTLDSLTQLSEQLQQQLDSSGPKLDKVLDETAGAVAVVNAELPGLSALMEKNLQALESAISAFQQTMTNIDGQVAYDSATMYRLNNALQEMSRAGRALQSLAKTLEEQPESLIQGKSGDKQ
jgi:paraquat-inducible protein B